MTHSTFLFSAFVLLSFLLNISKCRFTLHCENENDKGRMKNESLNRIMAIALLFITTFIAPFIRVLYIVFTHERKREEVFVLIRLNDAIPTDEEFMQRKIRSVELKIVESCVMSIASLLRKFLV